MNFGTSKLTIVPMYSKADCSGLLVSQILFGELFKIIRIEGDSCYIKLDFDGTEGWVENTLIEFLSVEAYQSLQNSVKIIFERKTELQVHNMMQSMTVLPGSEFRLNGPQANQMMLGETVFTLKQRTPIPYRGNIRYSIVSAAKEFLFAPRLWGGRTLYGIDNAGFIQIICKLNGITLPRFVTEQVVVGRTYKTYDEALPGDILFFTKNKSLNHVGILIENNCVIHVDNQVTISQIVNNQTLYSQNTNQEWGIAYIKNVID